jgi:lipoate-protein ligase A
MDRARYSQVPVSSVYPFEQTAIVAGRGSDLEQEVNLSQARMDGIPIFRRLGGGCSVFLDPGNLIVSIAFPAKGFGGIQTLFNQSSQWLIQGFQNMGITGLYQDGISDLVLENKKIGGSCFYRTKGFAYYSAAILVKPDLDLMARYLPHPPREPEYRKGRSHKEFLSGLDAFWPGITVEMLARELVACMDPFAVAAPA